LSDTLSASFTDLWNSLAVEGTDPPIITSVPASPSDALEQEELSPLTDPGIPVIPRYSIVTLDASLDYTTLASKSGIEATPALITDAEDTAAYNTAVLAAQNAIVPGERDPETGDVMSKTGQCYKLWWPSYSSVSAGNHRRAVSGSTYEYWGKVR